MKLFDDSELMVKDRPKMITSAQDEAFYRAQAKEIIKQGWSTCDLETVISDLEGVTLNDTGYEIAKDLENGWDSQGDYNITIDFMEFLESLSSEKDSILQDNVKQWAKAHKIKPVFVKGQKLRVDKMLSFSINAGEIVYVTRIIKDRACYLIDQNKNRRGGIVIAFEEAENKSTIIENE